MIRRLGLVGFTLFLLATYGQAQDRYMVFFTDKAGSAFSINSPQEFLSPRSIARRQKQSIPIIEQDLPVNSSYVMALENLGAETYYTSKWLNGVLIQAEALLIPAIEALDFVDRVEYVAPGAPLSSDGNGGDGAPAYEMEMAKSDFQNEMLGIDHMHADGFKGAGILIGVFDEGFNNLSNIPAFEHLFLDNRIRYTYNYSTNSPVIENAETHGTRVLSTLAAVEEGELIGTAPEASYILAVTEASGEYRVEEYYWLFAAEQADSAGVDIINTSLGYYRFDDPAMDYEQSDMDGQTAVITRASNIAASKGILLLTSAGNTGLNAQWPIITAPGDSPNVLAVAAVNSVRERARTSSLGPSADNRTKPDLAALGIATAVISSSGTVSFSDGTSFASPLITGLAAGLWQANPELTAAELLQLLRLSGHQYDDPDNEIGFGIPDYPTAIRVADEIDLPTANELLIYPNPTSDNRVSLAFDQRFFGQSVQVVLVNSNGRSLNQYLLNPSVRDNRIIIDLEHHSAGLYLVRVSGAGGTFTKKLIKY